MRTLQRTLTAVALAATLLVACAPDAGVTRSNVIKDLSTYGTVDTACVDSVLGKYSDAELGAIDAEARAIQDPTDTRPQVTISKAFRDLYASLFTCVTTTTG